MRLSAADIRQQQFAVKLIRGFDPQEVDAFLEEIADEFDELARENNLLKEQLTALEERLRGVEARERTLQETLVTTQKMAERFEESARQKAELIGREAQLQAERILEDSAQQRAKAMADIHALRQQRRQLAEQLRAILTMHARLIDEGVAEPDAADAS